MAKRRITLTSQEMNEINNRTQTLESQLKLSNDRVEELEIDLGELKTLVTEDAKDKDLEKYRSALLDLINHAINPPVKAKVIIEETEEAVTS